MFINATLFICVLPVLPYSIEGSSSHVFKCVILQEKSNGNVHDYTSLPFKCVLLSYTHNTYNNWLTGAKSYSIKVMLGYRS